MADDRHDDAPQDGSSQKHSPGADVETTEGFKAADRADSGTGEASADTSADNGQDGASREGGWQSHSSGSEASPTTADESGSSDMGGAVGDRESLVEPPAAPPPPRSRALSAVFGAFSGALAAGFVIAGAWLVEWPLSASVSAPQVSVAQFGDLSNRVASVESKAGKPAAPVPDPAVAARVDDLEKSVASLRDELAAVRGQSEKLSEGLKDGAAVPQDADGTSDRAAINARLAHVEHQVEQAAQTLTAEAAKRAATPSDDVPLRRVVAATLLDVAVRQGRPYGDLLTASKALISDPATLKSLEPFAESGVPSANVLSRELLAIVPKIAPAPPVMATTGSNIVDRLQQGAARLVHVERIDGSHKDSASAIVERIAASARQNDVAAAKAALNSLPPADRTAAESWIARVDARDAALAASRQFAVDAMSALNKPAP
jgi:hypothetical protein